MASLGTADAPRPDASPATYGGVLLPRELEEPRLWVPIEPLRKILRDRLRFDLHFRKRPWLPDMQHLAHARHSASLPEAILAEVGAQTIVGCFNATNELVESLAEFLIASWTTPASPESHRPRASGRSKLLARVSSAGLLLHR